MGLTIELDAVVFDRLQESPSALLFYNNTLLLSTTAHDVEDKPERNAHEWSNDRKSTISPSPSRAIQEALTQLRTSKRIDNVRTCRESKPNSTIPKIRGIGDENIEDVVHSVHSAPVEDLGCSVGLHVPAEAHHDQGEQNADQTDEESVGSANEIDEFSEWELGYATDKVGDDARDACQSVECEFACHVGCPGPVALLLERVCEGDEPNAVVVVSINTVFKELRAALSNPTFVNLQAVGGDEPLLCPCHGDSLHFPETNRLLLVYILHIRRFGQSRIISLFCLDGSCLDIARGVRVVDASRRQRQASSPLHPGDVRSGHVRSTDQHKI